MRFHQTISRGFVAGLAGLLNVAVSPLLRADAPVPGIIEVKASGSGGVPVILIPGLATPAGVWDDTVKALARDHVCYTVNLAGFGEMPPVPKREHFLADVRDAMIAYAREHKIDHPVIVGHSLGGVLALDIAAKAPDLPARVVVVDSLPFLAALMSSNVKTAEDAEKIAPMVAGSLSFATQEQFAAGQKMFIGGMVTSPEKAAAIAELTGKSNPATVGQAMGELITTDLRPELPRITCPVLVLGAMADKVSPTSTREQVEAAYRAQYTNLPQVKFQFFPESRHFIMVDDRPGFEAAIFQQLAEAGADRSKTR